MPVLVRLVAIMLAILVAAIVATGCDGSTSDGRLTKRAYIERFNEVQRESTTLFAAVHEAGTKPEAVRRQLAAFDAFIERVSQLKPPTAWDREHREMVESLGIMRDALAKIARADAADDAAIEAQVGRFSTAQRRFEAAVRAVNASR